MDVYLEPIYRWYSMNRRDLPWRKTTDPYKIWISEIILQQTRVTQGIGYYLRFIDHFPDVQHLAKAHEDKVLKLWQGLGYYSRARNLHASAKYIWKELDGKFPDTYSKILKLKGVGPYTAAAIASIAFDQSFPAIDGNIYRIFSRYFGISTPIDSGKGKKEIAEIAKKLMPPKNAGFHNQALMEFGALQCIPKSPDCNCCPVQPNCYAANHNKTAELPVKIKKTKQTQRFFYYYFIKYKHFTYLEKRTKNDIWRNLYQFPLFESGKNLSEIEILSDNNLPFPSKCNLNVKSVSAQKKHILSHQVIFARLIHVEIKNANCLGEHFIQVNQKDISTFAVPKLVEQFIKELDLNENNIQSEE